MEVLSNNCNGEKLVSPPDVATVPACADNMNKPEEDTNDVLVEREPDTKSNLSDKNNDPLSAESKLTGKTRKEWI